MEVQVKINGGTGSITFNSDRELSAEEIRAEIQRNLIATFQAAVTYAVSSLKASFGSEILVRVRSSEDPGPEEIVDQVREHLDWNAHGCELTLHARSMDGTEGVLSYDLDEDEDVEDAFHKITDSLAAEPVSIEREKVRIA